MADQLTPGTGWLARQPRRLSLRAYTDQQVISQPLLTQSASEVAGSTVITARLRYGGLGSCQGGTLTLIDAPSSWSGLDSRLVVLDLESEHGTHTVYRAVLSDLRRDGRTATANLSPLHTTYIEGPADEGQHPLSSPLITNVHVYGVNASHPPGSKPETRRTLLDRACEPYPDADYGAHPSGAGVIGFPSAATPVLLSRAILGAQFGVAVDQGYARPNYVTDWVLRTPDGFDQPTGARSGLPMFIPRRLGEARADPVTRMVPTTTSVTLPTYGAPVIADGQEKTYDYFGFGVSGPHVVQLLSRTGLAIPRTLRIRVPFVLTGITGGVSGLYITVATPIPGAGKQVVMPLDASSVGLVQNVDFEIAQEVYSQVTSVNIYLVLAYETTATELTLQVQPIQATTQVETVDTSSLVMPDGWTAPVQVGPMRDRTVHGAWLIPPGRDVDLGQYAAGVEVAWDRGAASSTYRTQALPYPGQRRTA